MSEASLTTIDICVCTFQRAHIVATLSSLFALTLTPDLRVRIVVADNDETPSAKAAIEGATLTGSLPVTYIHTPARNISLARNACLNAATAAFVAFIDDDELATPNWLLALIETQKKHDADIVLGPVEAQYAETRPDWACAGDFFSTRPVFIKGQIITGYTCNVLIRRAAYESRGLRFLTELGRSGGEDTVFFTTLHRAGCRFDYASGAMVTEIVAPTRLRLGWLAARSFRSGQTHGTLLLQNSAHGFRRLTAVCVALGKVLVCLLAMIFYLPQAVMWRKWLLRGLLHAGVVARLLGKSELTQYG